MLFSELKPDTVIETRIDALHRDWAMVTKSVNETRIDALHRDQAMVTKSVNADASEPMLRLYYHVIEIEANVYMEGALGTAESRYIYFQYIAAKTTPFYMTHNSF
jgi:hypothetical protein